MRLFEFNQSRLVNDFGTKLVDKFYSEFPSSNHSAEQIINFVANDDPTPNKELVMWCLSRYVLPNGYNPEKFPNLKQPIKKFEDIASRAIPELLEYKALLRKKNLEPPLQKRDINQITGLNELHTILSIYDSSKKMSNKDAADAEEQELYDEHKAFLLYNSDDIKVVEITSKEAAIYFGKGTQWCTAATKAQNLANSYLRQGSLYDIFVKGTEEKYQFHFETDQFADVNDESIDPIELANIYPVLWKIFTPIAEKNGTVQLNLHPSKETQMKDIAMNAYRIQYIKDPSEDIQLLAVNRNANTIMHIKNPTDEVIMTAIENSGNGKVIKYIQNLSHDMMKFAVNYLAGSIQYMKNPPSDIQWIAIKKNPYLIRECPNINFEKDVMAYAKEELRKDNEAYVKSIGEK